MQILHGCGHPHCKTSTCATFQQRTSKRPHRNFTKLSARALAIHLASQDRAENRLCPYQSAIDYHYMSQDERRRCRDERAAGAVDEEEQGEQPRAQSTEPAMNPSISPATPEQIISSPQHDSSIPLTGNRTSSRPRSTTEILSSLNEASQQEGSNDAGRTKDSSLESHEIVEKKDPKSFTQNLLDTRVVKFLFAAIFLPCDYFSSEQTKNVNRADPSPAKDESPDSSSRKEELSEILRKRSKGRSTSGRNRLPCPPKPVTEQGNYTDEVSAINNIADTTLVTGTLTHFSLQNIKAIVKLVQECEKTSSTAQHSSHPEPYNASHMRSRLFHFADQSMFHVFNNPRYTLASFRKSPSEMKSSSTTVSIDFGQMVQAFHWLSYFYQGMSIAMSGLPNAIKSLHISLGDPKSEPKSSKRSSKTTVPPRGCKASEIPGKDTFRVTDEQDAAHIALQAFAVLVASIPPCSLVTWHIVYTCHQGGMMVPPKEVNDSATIRSAQEVLDAFEDERALNLLTRLCEALATRVWVSDMECIARREQREQGEEVSTARPHVVECILDTLFESQQWPLLYRTRNGNYAWRYGSAQPRGESDGAPRYIGIISEWLRHLVGKQWDGKAEIDRFSAVGGALEILWYFGRSSHVRLQCWDLTMYAYKIVSSKPRLPSRYRSWRCASTG